jgi:hypothetical protein
VPQSSGWQESFRSLRRLLVTASVVPSSPILVTLMMGALRSSETSVLTRAILLNIPEGAILGLKFTFTLESRMTYTGLTWHLPIVS